LHWSISDKDRVNIFKAGLPARRNVLLRYRVPRGNDGGFFSVSCINTAVTFQYVGTTIIFLMGYFWTVRLRYGFSCSAGAHSLRI
jgi:hypothetical protein